MYSNQATYFGPPPTIMLTREPYEMVTDQILDEFCILKFKRFECITVNIVGSEHKGIIVHEVEILYQGSEVKLVKDYYIDGWNTRLCQWQLGEDFKF